MRLDVDRAAIGGHRIALTRNATQRMSVCVPQAGIVGHHRERRRECVHRVVLATQVHKDAGMERPYRPRRRIGRQNRCHLRQRLGKAFQPQEQDRAVEAGRSVIWCRRDGLRQQTLRRRMAPASHGNIGEQAQRRRIVEVQPKPRAQSIAGGSVRRIDPRQHGRHQRRIADTARQQSRLRRRGPRRIGQAIEIAQRMPGERRARIGGGCALQRRYRFVRAPQHRQRHALLILQPPRAGPFGRERVENFERASHFPTPPQRRPEQKSHLQRWRQRARQLCRRARIDPEQRLGLPDPGRHIALIVGPRHILQPLCGRGAKIYRRVMP